MTRTNSPSLRYSNGLFCEDVDISLVTGSLCVLSFGKKELSPESQGWRCNVPNAASYSLG